MKPLQTPTVERMHTNYLLKIIPCNFLTVMIIFNEEVIAEKEKIFLFPFSHLLIENMWVLTDLFLPG
jgi:hypothetical protein